MVRYAYLYARNEHMAWADKVERIVLLAAPNRGTYLFGQTVKKLPAMEFGRVYLAGSVLPKEYDWRVPVDEKQIERVTTSRRSTQKRT
jgi:hypothetical protein